MRLVAIAGGAIVSIVVMSTSARAQDIPLAQLLPDLILRDYVVQPPPSGVSRHALPSAARRS
jgi:hypothetical protein